MSGCGGKCSCSSAPTLIFPCSGAADVGEISDRTARQMSRSGDGSMFCLAGIGGRVSGIMATTAAAGKILAIDGCPLDCARHTIEQAGFKDVLHVRVTDMGLKKGSAAISDETISLVTEQARAVLNGKG